MTRRQMAFRVPLAEHPDDRFVYAEDVTPLTRREILRIVAGGAIALVVAWLFISLLALAGPA